MFLVIVKTSFLGLDKMENLQLGKVKRDVSSHPICVCFAICFVSLPISFHKQPVNKAILSVCKKKGNEVPLISEVGGCSKAFFA